MEGGKWTKDGEVLYLYTSRQEPSHEMIDE